MTHLGQFCLLSAFLAAGFAAFACLGAPQRRDREILAKAGLWTGLLAVLALTIVCGVLAWALLVGDFRFAYVGQYSSRSLPWHYRLSAFWVGQSGSMLLWTWFSALLAAVYRLRPQAQAAPSRNPAFGVLMAWVCFLTAIMVFAADPMEPSIDHRAVGEGLSPALQHPAMLIHPPIVFLAYAGWTIPFALAITALMRGHFDTACLGQMRWWSLFSWAVLGIGILVGAAWAYEELGWGGYWSWDPVENGSLIPWLTGTALLHALAAWHRRGLLKKTAIGLSLATFGLCNFAAFLTRSGIFSSLHAFSRSPIGWAFLALMVGLCLAGGLLLVLRRSALNAPHAIGGLCSREAGIVLSILALVSLAAITLVGTLSLPLSDLFLGRSLVLGQSFYNSALVPTGLLLLGLMAASPLLEWGGNPGRRRRGLLAFAAGVGAATGVMLFGAGVRSPIALAAAGMVAMVPVGLAGQFLLDLTKRRGAPRWLYYISAGRRPYAGFLAHLGLACLAVGVVGSSIGSRQQDLTLRAGQTVEWAGRSIQYVGLRQTELPGKLVFEAELSVRPGAANSYTLLPAQHLHRASNQWTSEVAIHPTWLGDFYAILHSGQATESISLTVLENPMMRWIWLSGWIASAAAVLGLWPLRRRKAIASIEDQSPVILRLPARRLAAAAALLMSLFGR